ncbi:hypothetical protein VNO77_42868 [Canavalia gladiata]|uniref:Uncharacterized protein n=1 Tax=Canavalia gladiata TaxID=3824 RepID=A0AAN9PNV4_CANGL
MVAVVHGTASLHPHLLLKHCSESEAEMVQRFNTCIEICENNHKDDTFTVSYLINSCGVFPTLAMKLSNRVRLKNPNAPNAVIDLLKNYGFSEYEILRSVVLDDKKVATEHPFAFTYNDLMDNLVLNIEVLRQCGVPQSSITLLMVHSPSAAYAKHSKFVEAVKAVEEVGFNPLKIIFVMAVQVLVTRSKAVWDSRFEVYERWGWNREMVLQAFRKFPNFMKLSEKMVTKKK